MDNVDLIIQQGKTFSKTIRVEVNPLVYVPITDIANRAPVRVTAPNHQMPDGWRATVIDAVGMSQINAKESPPSGTDWHRGTVVNSNVVEFNDLSTLLFDPYESGGALVYYTPQPMASYTARMKIKKRIGGELLETLTTEDNEILIDAALHTLTLSLAALTTAAYAWRRGVYDLELVSPTDVVIPVMRGAVYLQREVTTD